MNRADRFQPVGHLPLLAGLVFALALASLSTPAPASAQGTAARAPDGSVQRVTDIRRLLRSACLQLQPIASGTAAVEARRDLLASAAARTEQARTRWAAIRSAFPAQGPGAYAHHPDWSAAADAIAAGIDSMLERIRSGDASAARSACGANCGRFTALNEHVGLQLSPDALFRFRQTARPLADDVAGGDLETLRAALPRLAELRDLAVARPATGPVDPAEQSAALAAFSARLDAFARAVREGSDVAQSYEALMAALEQAYDAVL